MLKAFTATATTCEASAGIERSDAAGIVSVRDRVFTDVVRSKEPLVAGVNQPVLDIEFNPADGTGSLSGRFTLQPNEVEGTWEGRLEGVMRGGLITASGLARGTGALSGAAMRIDFRQVNELADPSPCDSPIAFFEMEGAILEQE